MDAFYEHVEKHKGLWIERLAEAVAIPSVSAEPAHRPDCVKIMEYTKAHIERLGGSANLVDIGLQTMPDGSKLPLPPILTGCIPAVPAANKKTVLLYGHLDVQPAKKSDGWNTEPFVLTEKDGKLYGRGSTDDKGPVLSWLWVVESYQALGKELPVNIKLVLEGMEESGSEGLEEFTRAQAADKPGGFLSGVDYVCISDNYWLGARKPCITYGLRGICYFTLEVTCSCKDLHSGVYGGPVAEAMQDLVKVMAKLNHDDGSIAVPGIYSSVRAISAEEQASYGDIDFDPEAYRSEIAANKLRFDDKAKILQARWRNPTLSLHGIEGAWSGAGAKTVIPAKVIGKFSLRIVPDMTPEEVESKVSAYVSQCFKDINTSNSWKLSMMHGAKAWLSDVNGPNYAAARKAIQQVFGQAPDLTREGGSIPPALWFEEATGKTVLLLPIGACDDSAHSTNEKFNVSNYIQGIKVLGTYLEEVAKA